MQVVLQNQQQLFQQLSMIKNFSNNFKQTIN